MPTTRSAAPTTRSGLVRKRADTTASNRVKKKPKPARNEDEAPSGGDNDDDKTDDNDDNDSEDGEGIGEGEGERNAETRRSGRKGKVTTAKGKETGPKSHKKAKGERKTSADKAVADAEAKKSQKASKKTAKKLAASGFAVAPPPHAPPAPTTVSAATPSPPTVAAGSSTSATIPVGEIAVAATPADTSASVTMPVGGVIATTAGVIMSVTMPTAGAIATTTATMPADPSASTTMPVGVITATAMPSIPTDGGSDGSASDEDTKDAGSNSSNSNNSVDGSGGDSDSDSDSDSDESSKGSGIACVAATAPTVPLSIATTAATIPLSIATTGAGPLLITDARVGVVPSTTNPGVGVTTPVASGGRGAGKFDLMPSVPVRQDQLGVVPTASAGQGQGRREQDILMASPPRLSHQELGGASCTHGGILRGRAHGNHPNFADMDSNMEDDLLPYPGKVYIYFPTSNNPSDWLIEQMQPTVFKHRKTDSLRPVLSSMATKLSLIRKSNKRIYTWEDSWVLRGRYEVAISEDEQITWELINDEWILRIIALSDDDDTASHVSSRHTSVPTSVAAASYVIDIDDDDVQYPDHILNNSLWLKAAQLLGVPPNVTQLSKDLSLRQYYQKWLAYQAAWAKIQVLKRTNKWPLEFNSFLSTELINLFGKRGFWSSHIRKAFGNITQYPNMETWLGLDDDGSTPEEDKALWGVLKAKYTFKDLELFKLRGSLNDPGSSSKKKLEKSKAKTRDVARTSKKHQESEEVESDTESETTEEDSGKGKGKGKKKDKKEKKKKSSKSDGKSQQK